MEERKNGYFKTYFTSKETEIHEVISSLLYRQSSDSLSKIVGNVHMKSDQSI